MQSCMLPRVLDRQNLLLPHTCAPTCGRGLGPAPTYSHTVNAQSACSARRSGDRYTGEQVPGLRAAEMFTETFQREDL
jgi:hypothetical protein